MKNLFKLSTIILLSITGATLNLAAHEEDEAREVRERVYTPGGAFQDHREGGPERNRDGSGELQREVNHLNGMLAHVERSMNRYRAGRDLWSEYRHLQTEVRQINRQFRRGEQSYNRRRLRAEIAHMHDELHHIEQELHMPARLYYQWR